MAKAKQQTEVPTLTEVAPANVTEAPAVPATVSTKKGVRMQFSHKGSVMTWTATDSSGKSYTAECDVSKIPSEIYDVARDHGFKQKIADSAAKSRDSDSGLPAALAEKFDAMIRTIQNLYEGRWNAVREGGNLVILVEALARITGKPVESVKKWIEQQSDDDVAGLYGDAKVIKASAEIRAERAAKNPERQAAAEKLIASIPD